MVARADVHYFGAGPAPLPTAVLEEASKVLLNYKDKGIGLCEISHRSPDANEILANAKAGLTYLPDIPDDYEILFLQSGGSGEFSAVVYNLASIWVEKRRARAEKELGASVSEGALKTEVLERLRKEVDEELKLDYLVTGSWSLKASQEAARLVGVQHVNVALDARKANDGKFGRIPAGLEWNLTPRKQNGGPALVYFCDNGTVGGVEFPAFPSNLEGDDAPPVVADMSSNFISRKVDVSKYAVIFGGAQKNILQHRNHHCYPTKVIATARIHSCFARITEGFGSSRWTNCAGLAGDRKEQLAVQYLAHLRCLGSRPGYGRADTDVWHKEDRRAGGSL